MLHSKLPQGIEYANVPLVHPVDVAFNTPDIQQGIRVATLRASASKPVLLKAECQVATAFNAGTTNELTVGTNQASANQILGSSDITEGTPGFYPAGLHTGKSVLTSDTEVWIKYTGVGVAATGTVTVTSTGPDADDTLDIAGEQFTFKVASGGADEITINATPATQAGLIADAINAFPALAGIVTASATAGVVTVSAASIGTAGNAITLAESAANVAVSGATLAGGTNAASTGAARVLLNVTPLYQGT
jgi:hypothetical protein